MSAQRGRARRDPDALLLPVFVVCVVAVAFRAWTPLQEAARTLWTHARTTGVGTWAAAGLAALGVAGAAVALYRRRGIPRGAILVAIARRDPWLGGPRAGRHLGLTEVQRTLHTYVLGASGSGKTQGVIVPQIVQDMARGGGSLLIEAKAEDWTLAALIGAAEAHHRLREFFLFSLQHPGLSAQWNPLADATDPVAVAERIFAVWTFEDEYYKGQQLRVWLALVGFLWKYGQHSGGRRINFQDCYACLASDGRGGILEGLLEEAGDDPWYRDERMILQDFVRQRRDARKKETSGLYTRVQRFAIGPMSGLLNSYEPDFAIGEILRKGQVLYAQLPTGLYEGIAKDMGRMMLQELYNAVARRQTVRGLPPGADHPFFSVHVDEFAALAYEGFADIIRTVRSGRVAITLAHQSLGDLPDAAFRDTLLANTGQKFLLSTRQLASAQVAAGLAGMRPVVASRPLLPGVGEPPTPAETLLRAYHIEPTALQELGVGVGYFLRTHPRHGLQRYAVRFPAYRGPVPALPHVERRLRERLEVLAAERAARSRYGIPVGGLGLLDRLREQGLPSEEAA